MPAADPYVPGHGNRRFSVRHYALDLDYKIATNHLGARAALEIEALEPLDRVVLDLAGLNVSRVRVNGRAPARFTHSDRKLRIVLSAPAASGERLSVEIDYAGKPKPMPSVFGPVGWEELTDGVLVAAQPCGAPSWFPCNDRPDDKATYRFAITVAEGYRVVANGVLAGREKRAGRTTWRFLQSQPMAPYLAVLHIGRYVSTPAGEAEIVHPRGLGVGAGSAFARQADMLTVFSELFGPYPFDRYSAVITADALEIPLEAQTLSTFGINHARPGWQNERLVAHELAHQWFGNSLTAASWADIWLHEGFACYSEWLWSEASGGRSADSWAQEHHRRLTGLPQDLVLGDPGREAMFDDWVYKRGALTLHALRGLLGEAFFTMLRDWTAAHRWGVVSTAGFTTHAQRYTPLDVSSLIAAWVYAAPLPPMTANAAR